MIEQQCQDLLDQTQPDPTADPPARLTQSLCRYFDFAATRPNRFRAMYDGVATTDPNVRQIVRQKRQVQLRRILSSLDDAATIDTAAASAIEAWLAFVTSLTLSWLARGAPESARPLLLAIKTLATVLEVTLTPAAAEVAGDPARQ